MKAVLEKLRNFVAVMPPLESAAAVAQNELLFAIDSELAAPPAKKAKAKAKAKAKKAKR